MTTITPALLRSWSCCWDDDQIARYFGRRRQIDVRVIASDESISLEDRLWVATRLLAHLDEHAARLYAVECALSVAHLAGDEDDEAQFRGICNWLVEICDLPPSQQGAARAAAVVNQLRSAGILQVSEEAESMVSKLMADNLPKATSSRLLKPRTKQLDATLRHGTLAVALRASLARALEWLP